MFSDIWSPSLTTLPTRQREKIDQNEPPISILCPSTIRRAVAGFVGKAVLSSCWRRIGGSRISWITFRGREGKSTSDIGNSLLKLLDPKKTIFFLRKDARFESLKYVDILLEKS